MTKSITDKFADLFRGSTLTYGQWNPDSGKMHTEKGAIGLQQFSSHLNGKMGAGVVPVNDEGMVWWGAIDIDNHGEKASSVTVEILARAIFAKGLPLVPCRSKSGGVHCYLFTSEPVPAALMQRLLNKWAKDLGFSGSEIFPKQVEIRDNQTGNWINLPYHNAHHTVRYAVEVRDGKTEKLTFDQFIDFAISCRLTKAMLRSFILVGHEQAPPCLQELIVQGVDKGVRNEVMYGFIIYLRKKSPPATYKQEAFQLNEFLFESPLPLSEVNKTISSASRKEYKYKCLEDPFRKFCDSKTCLSREYGIEPSDSFSTGEGLPTFTRLRVMDTEPPLWELTVDDKPIIVQTKTLRTFPLLAEEIMDRLLKVVPIISQKDWMLQLAELIKDVEHIEAPDNASTDGVIRERLVEFIDRADFNSNGKDPADKDLILRGLPVMQETGEREGKRAIYFRGIDFISYLKRTKSEELKGTALWLAIQKMGVIHRRTRIKGKVSNVWAVPVDGKGRTKLDHDYDPNVLFSSLSIEGNIVKLVNKVNF